MNVLALMYAFNGLAFSQKLLFLSAMMDALPLAIVLISVVVVCIIGWLVQYTTAFMLTRHSQKLGTYILIDMESRQIARLFFLKNLTVGGMALTLTYFALWRSRRRIRKMKISQLMDYGRQNEAEVIQKGGSRRKIFAASIVLGIAGTALILMGRLALGNLGF